MTKILLEGNNNCKDYEWEDMLAELQEILDKAHKNTISDNWWMFRGRNVGWRGNSTTPEWQPFETKDAQDLLFKIMPKRTDWSMKVSADYRKKEVYFSVTHHDNPVGGDKYTVRPINKKELEEVE